MRESEKIEEIKRLLSGVHPAGMTEIELSIRDVVMETSATEEELEWARKNTLTLEFAESEDEVTWEA